MKKSKMDLSYSLDTVELTFGQKKGMTAQFDEGTDTESPPAPPPGVLHAYFKTGSLNLLRDFRNYETESVAWNLDYTVGTVDSISLS